jgi:hypothetical protein
MEKLDIDTEIASWVAKEQKAIWHQLTPMGREGDPRELKGIYLPVFGLGCLNIHHGRRLHR